MKNNYGRVQVSFAVISLVILGLGIFGPNTDSISLIAGILALIALIIFDFYTPQIAGLSPDNPKVKTMRRLNRFSMVLVVIGFSIINWLPGTIMDSQTDGLTGTVIAVMLMVVIGNVAPKIPFNRYMGLRLPWTIRDEDTWKVAHKLLGYITFPIVLILILGSLLGDTQSFIQYSILAWIGIPGLYSGWFYYMRLSGKR